MESENLGGNNFFEKTERENISEVEKVGRKNSVILNHKYSDSIHVDQNHTNSNQPITYNSTKIASINDSADIFLIEKILSSPVHLVHTPYLVPFPPIFTYGTSSDPRSPSPDSSPESVTPKGNLTSCNNPPNLVPNVPSDPDSDSDLLYSSSSNSSDSSDDEYYKQRLHGKNNKKKC